MIRNSPKMHADGINSRIDAIYRADSRRVYATLVRLLGDLDLAEEAMHDAFRAALEQWPCAGIPENPRAWLVSTGRHKAIDALRRRARLAPLDAAGEGALAASGADAGEDGGIIDDRLRLVFVCCHPLLPGDAKVALTLREVCGLTTEEIARAFLARPSTIAQRIVRAKARIRDAHIPYEVPARHALAGRLEAVLQVVYLVFNEGYAASSGDDLMRVDLCDEAIRLGRLLVETLSEPEAIGQLALMLLHDARRAARTTPEGDLVLLEDQDRSSWDREGIAEGIRLVEHALASRRFGAYTLQAAIAAVHAEAPSAAQTDWIQIVGLYDALARIQPSPVVDLNRAVAIAMRDGPAAGLPLVDALADGALADYHLAHAARADLCRRLGRNDEARAAYRRALALARLAPERRFLEGRLSALGD